MKDLDDEVKAAVHEFCGAPTEAEKVTPSTETRVWAWLAGLTVAASMLAMLLGRCLRGIGHTFEQMSNALPPVVFALLAMALLAIVALLTDGAA